MCEIGRKTPGFGHKEAQISPKWANLSGFGLKLAFFELKSGKIGRIWPISANFSEENRKNVSRFVNSVRKFKNL